MSLSLQVVPARQGALWMRDGFRLFGKHPLAFSLLFVVFLAAIMVSAVLPYVGSMLMLCAVPLLGLGFMIASESALHKGPIHPGQFLLPLRTNAAQRNAQLKLCLGFGLSTLAVLWLAHEVDGGSFMKLQRLMAEQAPQAELEELLRDGKLQLGLFVRFGLAAVLSVVFWHAPALVHWGQQGAAQALFSSTVAMWRNRGAFTVYLLSWLAIIGVFGVFITLALSLLGMRQLTTMVVMPAGLIFSTVFYVSVLFSFSDSFGNSGLRPHTASDGVS
jgi:hypothetical protein